MYISPCSCTYQLSSLSVLISNRPLQPLSFRYTCAALCPDDSADLFEAASPLLRHRGGARPTGVRILLNNTESHAVSLVTALKFRHLRVVLYMGKSAKRWETGELRYCVLRPCAVGDSKRMCTSRMQVSLSCCFENGCTSSRTQYKSKVLMTDKANMFLLAIIAASSKIC